MKIMFIIIRYIQSSTLSILLDFIGEKKNRKGGSHDCHEAC